MKKLGKWYTSNPQSQTWTAFTDIKTGDLIRTQGKGHNIFFLKYPVQNIGANILLLQENGNPDTKTNRADKNILPPPTSTQLVIQQRIRSDTIHNSPKDKLTDNSENIRGSPPRGQPKKLASALRKGNMMGALDGSVKDGIGPHTWFITKK